MLTKPVLRRSRPAEVPAPYRYSPRRSGANDNRRLRVLVPRNPSRLARYGKTLLKLNPYLRLAGDALDVFEGLQSAVPESYDMTGWTANGTVCSTSGKCNRYALPKICGQTGFSDQTNWNAGYSVVTSTTFLTTRTSHARFYIDTWPGVPGIQNYTFAAYYTKTTHTSQPAPNHASIYVPALPVIALPKPLDWKGWPVTAFPNLAAPFTVPAFTPPVPFRFVPEWTAPNRQVSNGERKQPRSVVDNDWSMSIESSPAQRPRPAPRKHEIRSPPKWEKETKAKLSRVQALFLREVSNYTEAIDTVNAIYDALPTAYRPRYNGTAYEKRKVTTREKMRAIIDHSEHIDLLQALLNLGMENAEDMLYAQLGQMGGDISKRLDLPYAAGVNSLASRLRKVHFSLSEKEHYEGEN